MNRSDVRPPDWIIEACRLIDEADEGVPTLAELSEAVGVSPYHLQRKFKHVLGLSPREYAAQRRLDRFKAEVRSGESVSSAMYGAGFGSSSRLYERAGETLGMTPASYGKGGAGARIGFAIADSFLGRLLVASTDRGICRISIGDDDEELVEDLHGEYPAAEIGADVSGLVDNLEAVLSILSGGVRDRPGIALRSAGDDLSVEGLGLPSANSAGSHDDIYGNCRRDRLAEISPRRRPGLRDQPGGGGNSLSSGGWQRREAPWVSLGVGPKTEIAG